jgi:hypothetical protein
LFPPIISVPSISTTFNQYYKGIPKIFQNKKTPPLPTGRQAQAGAFRFVFSPRRIISGLPSKHFSNPPTPLF